VIVAARAIWKGVVRFGGVSLPVKLYSAVQDRSVHFRLLHRDDLVPVRQRMVDPRNGNVVPPDQIRRGFQPEDGEIVIMSDEDLAALEPEPSRDMEVTRFVDPGVISPEWYDRPYLLGPDGDEDSFSALFHALRRSGKEGLVRWTMRKKRYVGALLSGPGTIMLITLFHAEEVVGTADLPRPAGRPLEELEVRMAEQLVSALAGDFNLRDFRDEYRDRVMELVAAKDSGAQISMPPVEERRPEPLSLTELLQRSLERAKEERQVA
jgi:DNA end-binding protein Ku